MISLLRNKNFAIYVFGETISSFTEGFYKFGYVWLILTLSPSQNKSLFLGYLMGIYTLLNIFMGPIAGVFADRFSRKKIMIYCNLFEALLCFLLFLLIVLKKINILWIFLFTIMFSASAPFFEKAGYAIIPMIVKKEMLLKANSLFQFIQTTTMIASFPLGGIIYEKLGPAILFLFNLIGLITASLSVNFIKIKEGFFKDKKFKFFDDLRDGLSYIFSIKVLLNILYLGIVFNFIGSPIFVYLPLIVKSRGMEAIGYGFLHGMVSFGWLTGTFILGNLSIEKKEKKLVSLGLLVTTISILTLGIFQTKLLTLIAGAMFGVGLGITNTIIYTLIHQNSPPEKTGRVFSLVSFGCSIAQPVSYFIGGLIGKYFPISSIIIAIGILLVIATFSFYFRLRNDS